MDEEAGRNTEPSADGSDGNSAPGASGVPPLPADEVGEARPGSPYAMGYRSALAASAEDGTDSVKGGTVVSDSPAGGASDAPGTAGTSEILSGAASALSDRLDSGRQAMRQAAAATTSWFAGRAGTQTATRSQPEASTHPETRPEPLPVMDSSTAASSVPASSPSASAAAPSSPWSASGPGPASASASAEASGAGAGYGVGPSAARPTGYSSASTQGWHSRVTAADRRPDPARRGPRQAHLTLARVEPWSVMKFSFITSLVAFIILFVAIAVLYMALAGLGVFSSLQHTVSTITSSQGTAGTNISTWFSASRILGYTGMLGALNIVLITALSTIGSVIYNLIAHVFGGIEITLRETD